MPETETPQPLLRSRMPELDTLRGIAVLMVLFFHGFYFMTGARFHGRGKPFSTAQD
jgi:peptidoglycan/LPS O-acetylase OafA/YrhL